ncbi:hypothetical protein M422DRAFT_39715 [Sphaerobolus stellatus SS14]|uniref:Uncharacterized protein n=1 Tax=Sphaerobolus stellatus (strain SS14) TaxID=990650 RepID=A0A0C9UCN2_SPHS4|nr:hypothetical protein M422DRAFT_39715 [Sphaerobolus stellatus SS14]
MSRFEKLAKKNAGEKPLERWRWDKTRQQKWEEADTDVQEFYKRWRDSTSTELEDEVYIGRIPRISRIPAQFIVRKAYKTMFDHIWQRAFSKGVVITGQPGIGKTYFLWYALVCLIKKRQPVAFATNNLVYLFYDNRVWFTPAETSNVSFPLGRPVTDSEERWPFLFVLIDHDISTSEPIPQLHAGEDVFPIQASSPSPNRFKTWAKARNAALWGLPLWDETELNKALHLQSQYREFKVSLEPLLTCSGRSKDLEPELWAALDVLDKWKGKKARLLDELKIDEGSTEAATEVEEEDKIFKVDMTTIDGALEVLAHAAVQDSGPIARDVFEAIFYPEAAYEKRKEALDAVTYEDLQEFSKTFRANTLFPHQTISHRIVAVDPVALSAPSPKFAYQRMREGWTIDYRCVQIAREMTEKLKEKEDERLAESFRLFRSCAQSSALASWILEPIAHRILCANARQNLVLIKMRGDLSVDAPVLDVDFKKDIAKGYPQLPGGDRDLVTFYVEGLTDLTDNAYYIPERLNIPLFDSFLVERRAPETTDMELILWVFQISTSPTHGGSREGYVSIRRIIKSLKSSFETIEVKDGDGKIIKMQKREIKITVNYVYVTPREGDHTQYQWRCPGGWNKHARFYDHRGDFYCLRMPIPAETGAKSK